MGNTFGANRAGAADALESDRCDGRATDLLGSIWSARGPGHVPARLDGPALVGDLPIGATAARIRREHVSVSTIPERVDDYLEHVLICESKIFADVGNDNAVRRSHS